MYYKGEALVKVGSPIMHKEATMFLRNTWYVAGWSSEFDQSPTARIIAGEPLALFRKPDGELTALEDRCPHRWAPLSMGRVEEGELRCMYHGLKFSTDGRCTEVPGQERVPSKLRVRKFPVRERHQWVWIWMGDPDQADDTLIPDVSLLDQPWRRIRTGQIDYQAHHALISDNLLDLSHIAFLHEKTLGRRPDDEPADKQMATPQGGAEAKQIDRGIRYEGWRTGEFSRSVIQAKSAPNGDVWSRLDYMVPGIFISRVATYPVGAAAECEFGPPPSDMEALSDNVSCQAVTPMTQRTTRYFYSSGPRAGDVSDEEAEAMWEIAQEAFLEDRVMIEAQQKNIDNHPGDRMGGIAADRGPAMFRKMMERMMRAEGSSVDFIPPNKGPKAEATRHVLAEAD